MRFAALIAAIAVAAGAITVLVGRTDNGLVPVDEFPAVTNDYAGLGFREVCETLGSRSDLKRDGSDISPGDVMRVTCRIEALP